MTFSKYLDFKLGLRYLKPFEIVIFFLQLTVNKKNCGLVIKRN